MAEKRVSPHRAVRDDVEPAAPEARRLSTCGYDILELDSGQPTPDILARSSGNGVVADCDAVAAQRFMNRCYTETQPACRARRHGDIITAQEAARLTRIKKKKGVRRNLSESISYSLIPNP